MKLESTSIERTTQQMITSDFYAARDPVGVLGCASQWQYCNPVDGHCSVLSGLQIAVNDVHAKQLFSPRQMAVANRINLAGKAGYLMLMASEYLGSSFMVASSLLVDTLGDGLPDNQWVLELNHWMRVGFTAMQIGLNWWATGDGIADHDQYKIAPTTDEQWMCANQLVQRDDYASFSLLGIVLILVIGGVIIAAQLMLNRVANFHRQRWTHYDAKSTMPPFNAASLLQIQRMAFEGQDLCNEWEMSSPYDVVPVTSIAKTLKFEDLSLQAAPPPTYEKATGKRQYSKLQYPQAPSRTSISQDTLTKQMTRHKAPSVSYSRPFTHQTYSPEPQDAEPRGMEEGYRF